MNFIPCNGNCTFEGLYCEGCGRTHQEIEAMRRSVDDLLDLANKMKYENLEEFADAVSASIKYHASQISHATKQTAG